MQLLIRIVEDLSIMVMTILVLVVGFYLALLVLDRGLKWKTGSREEEGLADLWQATVVKPADKEEANEQVLERKEPHRQNALE